MMMPIMHESGSWTLIIAYVAKNQVKVAQEAELQRMAVEANRIIIMDHPLGRSES